MDVSYLYLQYPICVDPSKAGRLVDNEPRRGDVATFPPPFVPSRRGGNGAEYRPKTWPSFSTTTYILEQEHIYAVSIENMFCF